VSMVKMSRCTTYAVVFGPGLGTCGLNGQDYADLIPLSKAGIQTEARVASHTGMGSQVGDEPENQTRSHGLKTALGCSYELHRVG
jgi:hypothetical protein